ncbi:MAG TPA: gluconokinase [Thermomicrobiaceae bacterium]|nr:gluconokinase [Thermomicrobiaceae bacterium]
MAEDVDLEQVSLADAAGPLVLAIDAGSSSARAGLVDAQGRRLAGTLVQTHYLLETTQDGGAVLPPVELGSIVDDLIDRALAAGGGTGKIGAIAISTFWHSLLGIDESGAPVSPLYTWADTRATAMVPRLRERLDPETYHQRTGCILHPSYWPAKLLWIQERQPDEWTRARRWVSFGDFLLLRWFGRANCSISMASGTGLFNETSLAWDAPTLAAVGLEPDKLSPLGDEPLRGLLPAYATRWPALNALPWFPALGDGACSNVGSGAADARFLGVTIGTTGAMRLLWEGPAVAPPPGLWLYRLDARRVLLGGALSEGGNLYGWIASHLRLPDASALPAALEAIAPDSHGLTWLPFLAGERSPGWVGDARATLSGVTLDTTGVEVLRAGLEAVAERFALLMRMIDAAIPGQRTVVASGAALLHDPVWMQIMADALGREVVAPRVSEAAFRGVALVALERLGVVRELETAAAAALVEAPRYLPNPANHAVYQAALERQQQLYRALIADA